jgi:serine/threonine protein kinase
MCHVVKAVNRATGEPVAIKVLRAELVDQPIFLKRFQQEFEVARQLDHPHLCRAIEFGYTEGTPYLVMEFVEGQSLGDCIRHRGALPETEAVGLITQVGSALEAAHERKIVHRDVKPDNILLTADGQAKLTDLGLAKDADTDQDLTESMSGLGTPAFIAPEQYTDAKHADIRCDVYGLAATLYMAVTGREPFEARGHLSTLKKKLADQLVPPRDLVPTLGEHVNVAICQALSADPGTRPSTCSDFVQQLVGAPSQTAPVSGDEDTGVWTVPF